MKKRKKGSKDEPTAKQRAKERDMKLIEQPPKEEEKKEVVYQSPKVEAFIMLSNLPDDVSWDEVLAAVLRNHAFVTFRRGRKRPPPANSKTSLKLIT